MRGVTGHRMMSGRLAVMAWLAGAAAQAGMVPEFLNGVDANYHPFLASTKYDSATPWSALVWKKTGARRWADGKQDIPDLPAWFARQGVNAMRVRVWTDDAGPFGLEYAVGVAKRARKAGMALHPVLFLSDRWADLAKQPRPAAWTGLSGAALHAAVQAHATGVAQRFKSEGLHVVLWAVGNEADFGICGEFPARGIADVPRLELESVWEREAAILAAAIAGLRSVDPAARVAIHAGMTWSEDFLKGWFGFMAAHGVAFDVLGLSFYPSLGPMQAFGDLGAFDGLVARLHGALGRPVIVSEYAFPHTDDCSAAAFPDFCHRVGRFPATAQGQRDLLGRFVAWARTTPAVLGAFYWSPEWYEPGKAAAPERGWGPLALFGPDGRALPASRAFALGRTRRPAPGAAHAR